MRRENRKNNKGEVEEISKRKWLSVIGFLVSITLLSLAIFLSINEENNERMARANDVNNLTRMASSEISKTINEVKEENQENITQIAEIGNRTNQVSSNEIKETVNSKLENNVVKETNTNAKETENNTNNADDEYLTKQTNAEAQEDDNKNSQSEENNKQQFVKPVEGNIIKEYSMDSLIYSDTLQEWITHKGIDIKAEQSTPVKAVASGNVKLIKNDPRYGQSITIEHSDGFKTVYSCLLSTDFVHVGDSVEQGQQIGTVGNSGVFEVSDGSHLHFEMLKNDEYVNPDIYIK